MMQEQDEVSKVIIDTSETS